jgi:hypothetical protein
VRRGIKELRRTDKFKTRTDEMYLPPTYEIELGIQVPWG